MRFLLDTNVVAGLLRGHAGLQARVRRHAPGDIGLPAIVVHELFFGAFKSTDQAGTSRRLETLRFPVVDFDNGDARQAGEIRAVLAAAGTPIGPYDLLIAGQARARDLVLVTRNVRGFSRVDGLRVENWQDDPASP